MIGSAAVSAAVVCGVIPAQAGIQVILGASLDTRLRGCDKGAFPRWDARVIPPPRCAGQAVQAAIQVIVDARNRQIRQGQQQLKAALDIARLL